MVEFSPMTQALMMNNRRYLLGQRPSLAENLQSVQQAQSQNRVRQAQAERLQSATQEEKRKSAILSSLDPTDPKAIPILIKAGLLQEAANLQRVQNPSIDAPAAVREYEYFSELPEDQRRQYMGLKRAIPMKDMGGEVVTFDPVSAQPIGSLEKTLTPAQRPETIAAQERAKLTGKAEGEEAVSATKIKARMPEVESAVERLSALSEKADFSLKDRGLNFLREQVLGKEADEGSLAAFEYQRIAEQELLPSLSDIFNGPISDSERESVMGMLGDPRATPAQKKAAIKSFITKKKQQVQTKEGTVLNLRRKQAQEAIAAGRDPEAVRSQFKQMTGEEL